MTTDGSRPTLEQRLDEALADLTLRIDGGQRVDLETFVTSYPDIADELRRRLETVEWAGRMAGSEAGPSRTAVGDTARSQIVRETVRIRPEQLQTDTASGTTDGPRRRLEPADERVLTAFARHGRYRVKELLGRGAMGAVYLAEDLELGRSVALKVPEFTNGETPDVRERFYREARSAAALHHRNICPVYDIGEHEGLLFITMARIAGRPLSQLISRDRPMPPRQAAALVRKLALALDEAHRAGVIHRDLKPSNVMLDVRGEPVIMDFGLARLSGQPDEARLTCEGMIIGTPAYMSPEQIAAASDGVGPASDLYSLGTILYELLAGELPFQGPLAAVLGAILTTEPPRLSGRRPDLDPRLEAICLKMLAKRPEERYGSMREVADELTQFLRESRSETAPRPDATNSPPAASRGVPPRTAAAEGRSRRSSARRPRRHHGLSGTFARVPGWTWWTAASAALVLLLGAVIVIGTNNGGLRIALAEGVGEDVVVSIERGGREVAVADRSNAWRVRLRTGEYGVRIQGAPPDLRLDTNTIAISRGGLKIATVERLDAVAGDPAGEPRPETGDFALHLDGGNYIDVPDFGMDPDETYTLEAWVRPESLQHCGLFLSSGVGVRRGGIEIDGRHGIWRTWQWIGEDFHQENTGPVHVGVWQHVCAVWRPDGIFVYLDGTSLAQLASSGTLDPEPAPNVHARIGSGWNPAYGGSFDPDRFFRGSMWQLRISRGERYEAPFSPPARFEPDSATLLLYSFEKTPDDRVVDRSGHGRDGRVMGGANWTPVAAGEIAPRPDPLPDVRPPGGKALAFHEDGSHVRVVSLELDEANPVTFETWVRPRSVRIEGSILSYRGFSLGGGQSWHFLRAARSTRSGRTRYPGANSPLGAVPGDWVHLAGVYEDRELRLYQNGRQVGRHVVTWDFEPEGATELVLGSRGSYLVQAAISQARISSIARYTGDFTPETRFEPDEHTVALYRFDEGEGEVLKDSSGNGHHGRIYGAEWVHVDELPPAAPADEPGPNGFSDTTDAAFEVAVQGEYEGRIDGQAWGAQVVALGGGKFDLVLYEGGLPGAGWRRGDPRRRATGGTEGRRTTFTADGWSVSVADGVLSVSDSSAAKLGTLRRIERRSPTLGGKPPDGALVLFDGTSAEHFKGGRIVEGKYLAVGGETRETFGDHTLHIEFRTPFLPLARGQARGNSGIFIQNRYECQILDSFGLEGTDNECGGIYSIAAPQVNMCLPPLAWQTLDIDFTAARYENGRKVKNARVTIRHNGVVIHDDLELPHGTPGKDAEGPEPAGLYLQDHGDPVVFRNIWVVEKRR